MPKRHSYEVASLGGTPSWPFETSANGVSPIVAARVLTIVKQAADAIREIAPAPTPGRGGSCGAIAIRVFAASLEHVAQRWADKTVHVDGAAASQLRGMVHPKRH